jgi:hypothetical protein
MSDLTIQDLEKNLEEALALVGSDSYVDWEAFSKSSNDVSVALETLEKKCHQLREYQQKTFLDNSNL